ncbi:MAG TPA: tetratricopeptide repeat protein [Pyrinomonadaceae bacterium]|nr:tetratricopeptide repeat protein [Pyrinomonadaceae bacterium]
MTDHAKRTPTLVLLALTFFLFAPQGAAAQKPQEAERHAQRGAQELQRQQWRRAAEHYRRAVAADRRHVESNYGLGVAYMNLKQWQDALGAFSNVIEVRPNARLKDAYIGSGLIFFETQKFKEATDVFGFAEQLGELPPHVYYYYGKAQLQQGRPREALAALRRAAPAPQYAQDLYFSLGFLHLQQNESKEAVAALEQALRLNAGHAPTLMLLGNAYLGQERHAEAERLLRQALALDPNQFFTHYGLGYALLNQNRVEEAVASFTAALRLQPQSPEALVGLATAQARHPLNRFREAQTALEQAMRLKPDAAEPLMGLGVVYYSQGQYPALLSAAQQAARLAPQNANTHTLLAASYATVGQMREAVASAREALRLDPDNYWPRHVLGFIHVREDRPQEALGEARRAAAMRPDYPETQNLLAYVLNQLNQHQEALAAAQRALQLRREPADEGWAQYNIATALDKLGRRGEAAAAFRQSLSAYNQVGRTLDPDDLYLMGNAYLQLEQDEQAVAAFRQAIRLRPNFPQSRYNLGVAYFAAGNRKGAMDEYNALRRLDPDRAARLLKVINGRR